MSMWLLLLISTLRMFVQFPNFITFSKETEKNEKNEKNEKKHRKKKKKKFHAAQFLFTVGQEREERGRGRQEMATVVGDASLDVCNLTEMKREESMVFYGWTCLGSSV